MEEQEPILIPLEEETAVVAQIPAAAPSGPEAGGAPPAAWDREQFAHQVRALRPTLQRLCAALTRDPSEADDLLQNALVKAFQHRRSFQGRSPLAGWLYGIIRHEHDELRRLHARRRALVTAEQARFGEALGGLTPQTESSPEDRLCSAEDAGRVRVCLESLPEVFRAVVVFCDIEGLSYEQVAEILGLPVGTVKSRHARGRARLREALAG